MRRPLALILAAGSLAVGVPAAVAATGSGDPADSAPAASQPVQQQEQPRDRGDCPEHEGNGSGDDASATL
jgi:hypothetical protein